MSKENLSTSGRGILLNFLVATWHESDTHEMVVREDCPRDLMGKIEKKEQRKGRGFIFGIINPSPFKVSVPQWDHHAFLTSNLLPPQRMIGVSIGVFAALYCEFHWSTVG